MQPTRRLFLPPPTAGPAPQPASRRPSRLPRVRNSSSPPCHLPAPPGYDCGPGTHTPLALARFRPPRSLRPIAPSTCRSPSGHASSQHTRRRRRDGQLYNFFSAPGLSVNLKTENASFKMNADQLAVDGSFLTEAHMTALVGGAPSLPPTLGALAAARIRTDPHLAKNPPKTSTPGSFAYDRLLRRRKNHHAPPCLQAANGKSLSSRTGPQVGHPSPVTSPISAPTHARLSIGRCLRPCSLSAMQSCRRTTGAGA